MKSCRSTPKNCFIFVIVLLIISLSLLWAKQWMPHSSEDFFWKIDKTIHNPTPHVRYVSTQCNRTYSDSLPFSSSISISISEWRRRYGWVRVRGLPGDARVQLKNWIWMFITLYPTHPYSSWQFSWLSVFTTIHRKHFFHWRGIQVRCERSLRRRIKACTLKLAPQPSYFNHHQFQQGAVQPCHICQ